MHLQDAEKQSQVFPLINGKTKITLKDFPKTSSFLKSRNFSKWFSYLELVKILSLWRIEKGQKLATEFVYASFSQLLRTEKRVDESKTSQVLKQNINKDKQKITQK